MIDDETFHDWSPARRLNAVGSLSRPFDRFNLNQEQISSLLVDVILEGGLKNEQLNGLLAIYAAVNSLHSHMRIDIRQIPVGTTPRKIAQRERFCFAQEVADEIDMKVANGVKQDAAIQAAIERFDISRREAFRILKEVRDWRVEAEAENDPFGPLYEKYEVRPDGRLVPRK